jgi:hypothetical protein
MRWLDLPFVGFHQLWSPDMHARPRDLAYNMANSDEQLLTLPLDAARCKAREIIGQAPQGGVASVIEKWRQLPDGQIEFSIRHFLAASD